MCSLARRFFFFLCPFLLVATVASLHAQTGSGTITGTVTDASGAVVPGATVSIENPVSGLARSAKTDGAGHYAHRQPYGLLRNIRFGNRIH
jgi:hypothetical protein